MAAYSGPSPAGDFRYNTLLLTANGVNGAQNNTFLDSSTNNFTITRTGNVAQGTFSPFSLAEGQWSNYFDGSGDALGLTNTDLTGNFTIECWMYTQSTADQIISGSNGNFLGSNTQVFRLNETSVGNLSYYGGSSAVVLAAGLTTNKWYHLAMSRTSGTLQTFVDGTRIDSRTYTNTFKIGAVGALLNPNVQLGFNGYISNFRVINGTGIYSGTTITVPTSPLTAITNTSLLTCQSNRFKDNSSNNFTITRNGDTKVTAFSPFEPGAPYIQSINGGSAYFDANNDYLTTSSSPNLALGTGDFTIECWIYNSGLSLIGNGVILDTRTTTETNAAIEIDISNPNRFVGVYINGAYRMQTTQIVDNTWYHIALTRSGTDTRLFVNGVQSGSTYTDTINYTTQTYTVGGRYAAVSGDYRSFNGYISNLRVIKGTALYTTTFTPPTAPLTAVANTQLLLNCTNAGIIDNAGKNDIETVGNAQISTSVKKYGTGSMAFNTASGYGSVNDWLVIPNSPPINFGTGSFTVEMWVYSLQVSPWYNQRLIGKNNFVSSSFSYGIFLAHGNNKLFIVVGNVAYTATTVVPTGSWNHVALVYNSATGIATTYLNGTSVMTNSVTPTEDTQNLYIGMGRDTGGYNQAFNGYIDDLRITKGVARYTDNFTLPTYPIKLR